MAATQPIRISNSEIQTWKSCKRKWYLAYYRKLKPLGQDFTGPLVLGSRIHTALDQHYSTNRPLQEVWSELIAKDRVLIEGEGRDTHDFDNEAELGRLMLEGFEQWRADTGVDADMEVVSTEQRLYTPLLDGKVELMAKIDMRMRRRSDGIRFFRDWKTSANFSDFTRTAHMNEQNITYMLIEATQTDEKERCAGGLFTLLKKVKRTSNARPPFYDQVEVRHNIFAMRSFWARIHGELQEMLALRAALDAKADHHVVAYPRPSRDCTWACQFFSICPLFDDGSAVEQAIDQLYEVGEPYAYYGDLDNEKGIA